MGVSAGIACRGVGFPPEEPERVRAHPNPGGAAPDGLLVEGIECLEALHQPLLLEIGRACGGSGLRQIRVDLACGHDVPIAGILIPLHAGSLHGMIYLLPVKALIRYEAHTLLDYRILLAGAVPVTA